MSQTTTASTLMTTSAGRSPWTIARRTCSQSGTERGSGQLATRMRTTGTPTASSADRYRRRGGIDRRWESGRGERVVNSRADRDGDRGAVHAHRPRVAGRADDRLRPLGGTLVVE